MARFQVGDAAYFQGRRYRVIGLDEKNGRLVLRRDGATLTARETEVTDRDPIPRWAPEPEGRACRGPR